MKHPHAELMFEYAKDAMETDKPWEKWEYRYDLSNWWAGFSVHPNWNPNFQYRRKPKPYEPTLLDQALELEIEAANIKCRYHSKRQDTNISLWWLAQYERLMQTRTPAMIEHLKQQGKL